jgi:putative ABC transport system permease protein
MKATLLAWQLWPLVWREWRRHPARHAVAALAVALGVALAYGVHLINQSALQEFGAAVRQANGDPDLVLRGPREGFDDALFDHVAALPGVDAASPVLEVETYARATAPNEPSGSKRQPLRVLGVDALRLAPVAAALLPQARADEQRYASFQPDAVFANAAAKRLLGLSDSAAALELQAGTDWVAVRLAGSVAASGAPLLVMDIAAAQQAFGRAGLITRIDLRLAPGSEREVLASLAQLLPPGVQATPPGVEAQRVSNLSRAYRTNLTVLAGVALFVGAFLVYSVMALAIAQRTPTLALLGVLGLTPAERRSLVLLECAAIGTLGAAVGLLLGLALAAFALRFLAGDLGGGYFPGIAPSLHAGVGSALAFAAAGVASAVVGGWVPAQQAQALVPAQAIKGLGTPVQEGSLWARPGPALALLACGAGLALLPPVAGLPVAAYASVAVLLVGGVLCIPPVVSALLAWPRAPTHALALLAWRRARLHRATATAAVAGVVASLALSVALTVMVSSFRNGVAQWLDDVLPADLYARSASSSGLSEQAWFDDALLAQVERLPGVARVLPSRTRALNLAPGQPAVVLVARPLAGAPTAGPDDVQRQLPFVAAPVPAPPGALVVYASEALAMLHGAQAGQWIELPLATPEAPRTRVFVAGVWRDYARQFGSLAIDLAAYRALTGDRKLNELALWLQPGAAVAEVQQAVRSLLPSPDQLEMAASADLRALSLRIFDRSFAVTQLLQVLAIGIGLVGVAASLSAQVLARRKEFGLLLHLGFTRGQMHRLVAAELAAWLAAGAVLGVLLGLAVSLVLVHVVNPQSFHWTMELVLPVWPLAALTAGVWGAGVVTAAFSARQAASRSAVLSVKEDW